jgi:hypothetical protein
VGNQACRLVAIKFVSRGGQGSGDAGMQGTGPFCAQHACASYSAARCNGGLDAEREDVLLEGKSGHRKSKQVALKSEHGLEHWTLNIHPQSLDRSLGLG